MYNTTIRRKYIKTNHKKYFPNLFENDSKLIQEAKNSIHTFRNNTFTCKSIISKESAEKIIQSCTNFSNSNLPIISPNPYSNINDLESCILNEFAKEDLLEYVNSLNSLLYELYPQYGKMSNVDFFAFFTKNENNNHSLPHLDESHITVSVCLNNDFEGGEFVLRGESMDRVEIPQKPYQAVLFPGCTPHFTKPTKGKRYNLTFFLKQCQNKNEENFEDFYDTQYLDYLTLMGIRNVESLQTVRAFHVPSLKKIKEEKTIIKYSHEQAKKMPACILMNIFSFLGNKDFSALELTCKGYKYIVDRVWNEKYMKEAEGKAVNLKNTNYKLLYNSMSNGRKSSKTEKKIISIHINDMIGEQYLKYMSSILSINSHILRDPDKPTNLLFQNSSPGYYSPRSIFINKSHPSEFLLSNSDPNNIFSINSNSLNTYDEGNEINLNKVYDNIRKITEAEGEGYQFMASCESTAFNVGLACRMKEHISSYYPKKEAVLTPLLNSHDINTAILIQSWTEDFPVMQYELNQTLQTLKENNIASAYNSEYLIARAMYGIGVSNISLSDIIPFPGTSLLQHCFSPLTNKKLDLGEITLNALINPVFNSREKGIVKTVGCYLNFIGNIASKDVMSVVGLIKARRLIEFMDWVSNGFRCSVYYHKEIAMGEYLDRSVHCLSNTKDSLYFYRKVEDAMGSKQDIIQNVDVETVKDYIQAKVDDYTELYEPTEEVDLDEGDD